MVEEDVVELVVLELVLVDVDDELVDELDVVLVAKVSKSLFQVGVTPEVVT